MKYLSSLVIRHSLAFGITLFVVTPIAWLTVTDVLCLLLTGEPSRLPEPPGSWLWCAFYPVWLTLVSIPVSTCGELLLVRKLKMPWPLQYLLVLIMYLVMSALLWQIISVVMFGQKPSLHTDFIIYTLEDVFLGLAYWTILRLSDFVLSDLGRRYLDPQDEDPS